MSNADSAGMSRRNWLPLIRYSHIVSSLVGEILERDPLRDAGGGELTPRLLQLLEFIHHAGHHIDDVAKFLKVTPPAATKAVDRLEIRGLVSRGPLKGDRRVTLLTCTPEGESLVARYRQLQQDAVATAVGGFDDFELARLTRTLEKYALALVALDGGGNVCLRCSGFYDSECPLQYTQRGCAYASSRQDAS